LLDEPATPAEIALGNAVLFIGVIAPLYPPKADIHQRKQHVRLVPKADMDALPR
jgi:hypothetical protein